MKTIAFFDLFKMFPNVKEIEKSKGRWRIDFSQEMEKDVCIEKYFLRVEHY
jgi:hypothetical protein